MTQRDLADTMGMSIVQANRSLQTLRDEGLVVLSGKALHIPDIERLHRYSGFNPNYLHADRQRRVNLGLHRAADQR